MLAFPAQVPDPFTQPDAWDSISVSGVPWGKGTPQGGKIQVRGCSRFYKIDQKDSKGQDGSTQTYLGSHPKTFRLIFSIWTALQWTYWNATILPFFFYSGVINKVNPIQIQHPALAVVGVTSILVDDIGSPEIDEQTKELRMVLTVREYLPAAPGNASVTPVGAAPPASPGFVGYTPSPKIQQLTQIAAALQAQVAGGPATLP